MPRPENARCGRCKYVEPDEDGTGYCHANPPGDNGWPFVSLERGWCGEFNDGAHWATVEARAQRRIAAHDARDEAEDAASDGLVKPLVARAPKAGAR